MSSSQYGIFRLPVPEGGLYRPPMVPVPEKTDWFPVHLSSGGVALSGSSMTVLVEVGTMNRFSSVHYLALFLMIKLLVTGTFFGKNIPNASLTHDPIWETWFFLGLASRRMNISTTELQYSSMRALSGMLSLFATSTDSLRTISKCCHSGECLIWIGTGIEEKVDK